MNARVSKKYILSSGLKKHDCFYVLQREKVTNKTKLFMSSYTRKEMNNVGKTFTIRQKQGKHIYGYSSLYDAQEQ